MLETSRKQTASYQNKIIRLIEKAAPPKLHWWSLFEIDILKKYYGKKDANVIAKALGRSRTAIDSKAHELGLKMKP